jgi:galactokinase
MTGSELAAALGRHGLPPREIEPKAALFALALSQADPEHAGPLHAWWVPGRLEVFGKHTDYAGGRTLVCAVPRGFAVLARPRADGAVRVVDARRGQDVALVPARSAPAYTGWRHYVEVVARRLARNFPGAALGADIVIASDLPSASGMSSSSALLIAIASVLTRVGELDRRSEWHENITAPRDVAGYYACIENGLSFGSLAGDAGVGTHGGSEDHAAILTGVPGHVAAFAFVPMRALAVVAVPERWRFVLTPSGVPAQKAGTAREAYNRLAAGTGVLLDLWNTDSSDTAPSLAAALSTGGDSGEKTVVTSPAAVAHLRALVRRSSIPGWPHAALERRLDHFVREDARIVEALDAFRHADAAGLGALAAASQADAEALLGNQIPQTRALARTARERGAFAACSFGAGFGGSLWALVEDDRAEAFADRWHPGAFLAMPGPPVVELRVNRENW